MLLQNLAHIESVLLETVQLLDLDFDRCKASLPTGLLSLVAATSNDSSDAAHGFPSHRKDRPNFCILRDLDRLLLDSNLVSSAVADAKAL